jgi:apolipoprotein N-acyltransferase
MMGLGAADVIQVAQAETPHPRPWARRVLAAVASGLLLAASLPSLGIAPLAWFGLVPLLLVVREGSVRAAFLTGWLSGTTFFVAVTYWVVYTIRHYTAVPGPVAVLLLLAMSLVLGLYTAGFAAGVRWMQARRLPWVYLAPALWVVLEWLRGWFVIGFPWGALGYSQWRFTDLVQMVEVTGVYGLSALLVFFNAVLTAIATARGRLELWRLVPLSVLTVLMILLPALGRWRVATLAGLPAAGRLVVGVAQGNIAQDHKWDPEFVDETMTRYEQLTRAAAADGATLVIWPETATPFFFQEAGARREWVLRLARELGTFIVFGSPAATFEDSRLVGQRNRAYLVSPQRGEVDFYDKMQLVPFGEYVPFARVLFFVQQMVDAVGTLIPGTRATVFEGPGGRFGVLVCYEGVFPWISRRVVRDGAEFLVNITNDAWYGRTAAPYQHLAQATLRTIENRVPLVRAANTGISAVVDEDGRIVWAGPLDEMLEHTQQISWHHVRTFYTRFGDVFVGLCVLAVVVAGLVGVRRRPEL